MRGGRGPAMWVFNLSVAAFAFFCVPPSLTCAVADMGSLVTVSVLGGAALVIGTLTLRLRQHAAAARQRARQTAALSAMSRALARRRSVDEIRVALLVPQASGRLAPWPRGTGAASRAAGEPALFVPDAREAGIAQWVYEHHHLAGLGTTTLPRATALYLPLVAARGTVGVLGVRPAQPRRVLPPEQGAWLETFASQTALARIEAIPLSTMEQGLRWDWESFPQWMDSLAQHALGVNVGALVPFNPLRLYVMGLAEARE